MREPMTGMTWKEIVKDLTEGKEVPKTYHPDEGAFSDLDDLNDPAVEGF